jgi:glycosyltransferase involved in cell wall biosynthesis
VVVVPSVVADACPTVVLEAMAAGRPVVATTSGGIVDLVVEGETGLLVRPGDAEALAGALDRIVREPHTAQAFGKAGWERSRQFTISALAGRVEQMYSDAIEAKGRRCRP